MESDKKVVRFFAEEFEHDYLVKRLEELKLSPENKKIPMYDTVIKEIEGAIELQNKWI